MCTLEVKNLTKRNQAALRHRNCEPDAGALLNQDHILSLPNEAPAIQRVCVYLGYASCPETLWQRCRCPAPVKWRNAASAQTATQHMSEEAMSRPRRRQHGFDCQLKIPGPKLLTRSVVSLGFPCDTEEPLTGHALGQRNCENQSPTSFRPISKSHTLHVGQ